MTWSSASGRKELEAALRRVGGQTDDGIDLAEAGLLLAALDRPRVPLDRYRHHLSLLSRDAADLAVKCDAADSLEGRVETLRTVLAENHGYAGDRATYDDPRNANLMWVIERRKGLPVALGILYIHTARAQGWTVAGLNFPGHFLLRLESGGQRAIIDPFHGCRPCDTATLRGLLKAMAGNEAELAPEHYEAAGNRQVLLRLQANIKLRLLRDRRPRDALEIVESMIMIAPDGAVLWREAGLLHAHLGNLRAALMALEHVMDLSRDPAERHETGRILRDLRAKLN